MAKDAPRVEVPEPGKTDTPVIPQVDKPNEIVAATTTSPSPVNPPVSQNGGLTAQSAPLHLLSFLGVPGELRQVDLYKALKASGMPVDGIVKEAFEKRSDGTCTTGGGLLGDPKIASKYLKISAYEYRSVTPKLTCQINFTEDLITSYDCQGLIPNLPSFDKLIEVLGKPNPYYDSYPGLKDATWKCKGNDGCSLNISENNERRNVRYQLEQKPRPVAPAECRKPPAQPRVDKVVRGSDGSLERWYSDFCERTHSNPYILKGRGGPTDCECFTARAAQDARTLAGGQDPTNVVQRGKVVTPAWKACQR